MQNYGERVESLYKKLYGPEITMANLDDMANNLSQIADRDRPWTGKYLHSLIKGYSGFSANQQMIEAVEILTSRQAGIDEIEALAKETTVLSVNRLPPETIILGEAQRCANPGCQVIFVPTHPRQKYHSKRCARARY